MKQLQKLVNNAFVARYHNWLRFNRSFEKLKSHLSEWEYVPNFENWSNSMQQKIKNRNNKNYAVDNSKRARKYYKNFMSTKISDKIINLRLRGNKT